MSRYTKKFFHNETGKDFFYYEYLPDKYVEGETPLMVFLHGAGERGCEDGSELDKVNAHGVGKLLITGKELPFAVVVPQCPKDKYWGCYIESLNTFLDYVLTSLRPNENRIYLTGLSMGGTGTWLWSLANPERFAAIAPVCGTGVYWYGEKLVEKPVWAFHGDIDPIVPISESVNMVASINKHESKLKAKLTVFNGVGHNAWDYAYTEELFDWFLLY